MVVWCAIGTLLLMVSLLWVWIILVYCKQRDMQFEIDKLKVWKQRVEVATSTLNTNLLEITDTAYREHWAYEKALMEITKAIELWAERFGGLRKVDE